MKANKWLFIVLLLFIVLTISACTGEKEIKTEPAEVHVQVFFPESMKTHPLTKPYLDAVDEFNQIKPHIKVIIDYLAPSEMTNTNWMHEMVKLLESDKAPDVIPWSPGDTQIVGEKNLLRDLLPFISEEVDIPQQILDSGMMDGKLLVLPIGAHPSGVFYNKLLFDEAQIPYPEGDWTWDQLRDISKKMKGHTSVLSYDYNSLELLLASTGNGVLSPDGSTSIGYLDSPEAVRKLQWLNAFYRDVQQVAAPLAAIEPFNPFASLESGMFVGNLGTRFANFEGEYKQSLGVAPLPYFEGGQRANPVAFTGYAISSKSKYPEAAWEFIQYLTLEKNEHSLKLAKYQIPTSKSMAEAAGVSTDPINSIFNEELKFAVQISGEKNPFYYQAWNEDLKAQFQMLLTAQDEEIPDKLHDLAQKLDQEMNRLKSESVAQAENASP
jgi:multiple sugar transport system substrate-binding protein